jgi:spermidine synthase
MIGFGIYAPLEVYAVDMPFSLHNPVVIAGDILLMTLMLFVCFRPQLVFFAGALTIIIAELIAPGKVVDMERNFYGIVKIFDTSYTIHDTTTTARFMSHGTTIHGFQVLDKEYARTPTTYYTASGPVSTVFSTYHPKKVAIIGLGVGTMNCYGTPQSNLTFFEIDPAVVKVARQDYSFLSDCGSRKPPRIILGDGRLEMAKLKEKFDLIMLDAFSADAIPTHLLTAEALQTYAEHLEKNGLLLFNLSNRYFSLTDTVAVTAHSIGLKMYSTTYQAKEDPLAAPSSKWAIAALNDSVMNPLKKKDWLDHSPPQDKPLWTDDYTNLLSALHF